ncbi:hypothetical protein BG95_06690 [Thermosipho sp. 1063]|uniref:hypothetical protein n=1 Tax=Thermosipho sp. 1063 TaxID=1462747 RepID=UPI00095070C9|nr:hypothetical protein [Thermosipho sp. 1063]APT72546.1 hypothetical protein BG95_06690 [Thermosipho sp. 1063]
MIFFNKKKKKKNINFSICYIKNLESFKKIPKSLKYSDEVFFIISKDISENIFKKIKKMMKFKNYSIIYNNYVKLSKNIYQIKELNVKKLRNLENKRNILFSNNYMLAWEIAQMFPFYTIAVENNFLYFCTPIPLTKDASGFLLKKELEKDFIFNVKLDFKILKDILGG